MWFRLQDFVASESATQSTSATAQSLVFSSTSVFADAAEEQPEMTNEENVLDDEAEDDAEEQQVNDESA